jgi:hypothetical protein
VRRRYAVRFSSGRSFTVDVSSSGFCAELLRVLAPGSHVEGTIQVGPNDVPFEGSVVWAKAGDAYLGLRGRMGILFTRVGADLADLSPRGAAA